MLDRTVEMTVHGPAEEVIEEDGTVWVRTDCVDRETILLFSLSPQSEVLVLSHCTLSTTGVYELEVCPSNKLFKVVHGHLVTLKFPFEEGFICVEFILRGWQVL